MQYFICALFDPHSKVTLEGLQVLRDNLQTFIDMAMISDMEVYVRDVYDTDWISIDVPSIGNFNEK